MSGVRNLLAHIFKNYPANKPVTAGDIATKLLPDFKRVIEQQERDVARIDNEITEVTDEIDSEIVRVEDNSIVYAIALGGIS